MIVEHRNRSLGKTGKKKQETVRSYTNTHTYTLTEPHHLRTTHK